MKWFRRKVDPKQEVNDAKEPELADANLIVATAAALDDEYQTIMAQAPAWPTRNKQLPEWMNHCRALLYTLDSKPSVPFFCELPPGHEGKHGLPGVEYLHPDQHPLMVNVSVKNGIETTTIRENGEVSTDNRPI